MPCPQCQAMTKNGTKCKLHTCKRYPYCWIHQRSVEGLEQKRSSIPDGGLGLFATRQFPYSKSRKMKPITYYSSKRISHHPNPNSEYVLKVNNKQYLDSEDPSNFAGRYINSFKHHPERAKRKANVRFTQGSRIYEKDNRFVVPIYQKKKIDKGEELFINYGNQYPIQRQI